MNFTAVKQANGQNVTMFGTFNEIGGVSLNQNQKQVCKCQITDDAGEKHLIRIYNQNMPTPALLNMRQQFTLSSYQGQTQKGQPYTGFSGFWDDRAMINQVPDNASQAPQDPPQAPQQAPQPTNAPQNVQMRMPDTYAYPVTPETSRRMARAVVITAMLRSGRKPLLSYAEELVEFIVSGIDPSTQSNPDYIGDDPPPPRDDIPF
ncbi:hypothetical protein LCGC14_1643380 [marine sediment metagenome]|uniref:Uncharacterized protein n=1 Tax=marine sediment metagenome TaxID=412755 RepID=A0A0F9HYW6_9ZZZZ